MDWHMSLVDELGCCGCCSCCWLLLPLLYTITSIVVCTVHTTFGLFQRDNLYILHSTYNDMWISLFGLGVYRYIRLKVLEAAVYNHIPHLLNQKFRDHQLRLM